MDEDIVQIVKPESSLTIKTFGDFLQVYSVSLTWDDKTLLTYNVEEITIIRNALDKWLKEKGVG